VSGGTNAAIRIAEVHNQLDPGDVARALRRWSAHAHGPIRRLAGSCSPAAMHGCPCASRALLERVVNRLGGRPRREVRRLIDDIDRVFLDRTHPDPRMPGEWPWWMRRC
jgi:hypothetical protein